ncbi:MAG: hypothetical protein M3461_16320 [Pseudomonadota bacterium]|nr:hypothetical protein [Pseudomonadota bacterium]
MKSCYFVLVSLFMTACGDPSEIGSKLSGGNYVAVGADDNTGGAKLCPKAMVDELAAAVKTPTPIGCDEGEVKRVPKDQVEQKLGFFERAALSYCTTTACGNGDTKYKQFWCNPHC